MGEFRPPLVELGIKASENPRQSKETNRCENQLIEIPSMKNKIRCGLSRAASIKQGAWILEHGKSGGAAVRILRSRLGHFPSQ